MPDIEPTPTYAETLSCLIEETGTITQKAVLSPVMARIPRDLVAEVDAIAKLAKKSRTAMVTHLLYAGVEAVRRVSSRDVIKRIDAATFAAIQDFEPVEESQSEEV
jgi:hypothetical protein